ncbi:MAG: ferrous iron transport protein A [Desulfotalea sp.]
MTEQSTSSPSGYGSFPLALAAEGEKVKIVFIRGARKKEERLLSMGLKVDDIIEVQLTSVGGGKVVITRESHYALNQGLTHSIYVMKV